MDGHGLDQEVLNLDVALTLSLSDFKAYVNDVTSISTDRLLFIHNGRPLIGETTTLAQLGINDGEMLALVTSEQEQPQGQPQETASSARGPADMGAPDEIESIRRRLLQVPHDLATIRRSRPDLAAAVNDPARFRRLYEELLRQQKEEVRERERQIVELNKDPFNMEAQQKIAELIRQDRVTENLQHAMEHNPEGTSCLCYMYRRFYAAVLTCPTDSLWSCNDAVHQCYRQRPCGQSICRQRRSDHYHVTFMRRDM